MASRIRLVDITKLRKSASLVQKESEKVVAQAHRQLNSQEQFMEEVGMDRKALRAFINGDQWSAVFKHKARQELIRFNEELKRDIATAVSLKRKEIRLSNRLLSPKSKVKQSAGRHRTGFI